MKIQWLGHACVMITSDTGTRIIIDPYKTGYFAVPGGSLTYRDIDKTADVVLVSHEHPDHNNITAIGGNPQIFRGAGIEKLTTFKIGNIGVTWIPCYHDAVQGRHLGKTAAVRLDVDGINIFHDGDMGHPLSDEQLAEAGGVDVLLLCVGHLHPIGDPEPVSADDGKTERVWKEHSIDTCLADELYKQLAPRITIPIHYANDKCSFNLGRVEQFLEGKSSVSRPGISEVSISSNGLPAEPLIVILEPAL